MELGSITKKFESKKGNTVVFRHVKKEDLDAMWHYANGLIAEDTFIELCGKPLTHEDEEKFLEALLENIEKGKNRNVVVEVNGVYAGSGDVRVESRRHAHVAEIGISLGKDYREEGIGTELMKTLIDEAKKMGLRLLVLNCFENNPRAHHVYEKLGFIRAGIIPGAISFKGEYIGEVKYYLPLVKEK